MEQKIGQLVEVTFGDSIINSLGVILHSQTIHINKENTIGGGVYTLSDGILLTPTEYKDGEVLGVAKILLYDYELYVEVFGYNISSKEGNIYMALTSPMGVLRYAKPYYYQREDILEEVKTKKIFKIQKITHFNRSSNPTKQSKYYQLKIYVSENKIGGVTRVLTKKELQDEFEVLELE